MEVLRSHHLRLKAPCHQYQHQHQYPHQDRSTRWEALEAGSGTGEGGGWAGPLAAWRVAVVGIETVHHEAFGSVSRSETHNPVDPGQMHLAKTTCKRLRQSGSKRYRIASRSAIMLAQDSYPNRIKLEKERCRRVAKYVRIDRPGRCRLAN